jgi:F-type H+-transporting ATPase subunit b
MNINATILGQAVAFILFVSFCMKYVWPPIIAAVEQRQKEVSDTLINAETVRKEAHTLKANAIEQLATAKKEAQMIIEDAIKHRTQILANVKDESELENKRIVAKAENEIAIRLEQARKELHSQISSLVIMGAEKVIEHSVDEATNKDLIDKIVARL